MDVFDLIAGAAATNTKLTIPFCSVCALFIVLLLII